MAIEDPVQYARLRRDVGTSDAVIDDPMAAAYFAEAEEEYPNDVAKQKAYARVIAIQGIRASSALLTKYSKNQSSEDPTKVFDNLTELLRDWEAKLAKAQDPIDQDAISPFFFGLAEGRRGA